MRMEHSSSLPTGRERRIPIGVEILAAVIALAAVAFMVAGLAFLVPGFKDGGATRPQGGDLGALWVGVGAAAGAIFLSGGALHEVLAIGLIRLRNAARALSILLLGLSAAVACLGLMAAFVRFSHTALAWNIGVGVADAGALWYLLRPQIKEVFRG